jgi:chorismate mutase
MSPSRQERRVCAIRGATTSATNSEADIVDATAELLGAMLERNRAVADDLISIIFTTSPTLNAVFPATAARVLGILNVPLLCAQEIDVPGALPNCVRVLMHLHSAESELEHVYLGGARSLRGDLVGDED